MQRPRNTELSAGRPPPTAYALVRNTPSVMAALASPSMRCTTFGLAPAEMASDAAVCPVAGAQSIGGSDRTGRLGVMYFRSLLAQAGVAHGEFSPGEDYLAVDVTVELPVGGVRVQIKTGPKEQPPDQRTPPQNLTQTRAHLVHRRIRPGHRIHVFLRRTSASRRCRLFWDRHRRALTAQHQHGSAGYVALIRITFSALR